MEQRLLGLNPSRSIKTKWSNNKNLCRYGQKKITLNFHALGPRVGSNIKEN